MIAIDGRYYFINFEKIDKVLNSGIGTSEEREVEDSVTEIIKNEKGEVISEKITINKTLRHRELNTFRYQVISAMLDELLHGDGEATEDSGLPKPELDDLSLGMKLSFNTLLEYGIISFIDIKN